MRTRYANVTVVQTPGANLRVNLIKLFQVYLLFSESKTKASLVNSVNYTCKILLNKPLIKLLQDVSVIY